MTRGLALGLTLALGLPLGAVLAGCASTGQMQKLEASSETNGKLLRETEQRLHSLESSVASLNTQVAQLNNRVYEVRTRTGKKTSMTVVPIVPATPPHSVPAAAATPAQQAAQPAPAQSVAGQQASAAAAQTSATSQGAGTPGRPMSRAEALLASARRAAAARGQTQPATGADQTAAAATQAAASVPAGRRIDPAAAPTPLPAVAASPRTGAKTAAIRSAGPNGRVGQPEAVAGPSGALAGASSASTTLPPVGLPPSEVPATGSASSGAANTGAAQAGNSAAAAAQSGAGAQASQAVPVPVIPASNLALPPEHPGLPPATPSAQQPPSGQNARAVAQAAPQASAASGAAGTSRPLPRGEEAAYKAALNATLSGRTGEGIRLFHDFLQQYPNGRYAANADYWIGECLYAQGKYQDALAQFQAVNDTYPRHHKNADALLKAGMTLSRLGDKAAAAEKYRALLSQFPNSDAARRARAMGVGR